ncbi:MAG: hypothetical protein EOO43_03160 [Flavobacterium sp.]|nr:MAG: hypothetical protein EOO43_03160 [Flavobacterium sp.]
MTKSSDVPQHNIPRAVLIPIDDLLAIVEKYTKVDDEGNVVTTLKGVRAYFDIKLTDVNLPDPVTALVVPVDLKGNDLISVSDGLGEGDDTGIYDFTKPCPSECDPESPLFVP